MCSRAKISSSSPVITVRPEATVDEAPDLLSKHQVSGVPVVDAEGHVVGILSQFDLFKPLYDQLQLNTTTVARYHSTRVISVQADDMLIDVAEVFMSHAIRRVPVVDAENKLVGIISRRDIVRYIRDVRQQVAQEWRNRHPMPPVPPSEPGK